MFVLKVTGRNRPVAELDKDGEVVVSNDTSLLVHYCADERSARIDAHRLKDELLHSPEAQVELPDGSKLSLAEWVSQNASLNVSNPS